MTVPLSSPEREIQQFDWFLSGMDRNLPFRIADSGNFRNKIKICQLWKKMANNFRTKLWRYTSFTYFVRNFISLHLRYNSRFCVM